VYTNGASETFVGEFAKGHRQNMVVATKYWNALPGNDPNAAGNQRKSMIQGGRSEPEAAANGLHRSLLGSYLGRDHSG